MGAHHKRQRTSAMWEPDGRSCLERAREMRQPSPKDLAGPLLSWAESWFTDAETHDGGVVRLARPDRTDRSMVGGSMAEMPAPYAWC